MKDTQFHCGGVDHSFFRAGKIRSAAFLLSLWLAPPAQAQLFSDNFTRGSDPGPLTPWIAQSGNWTVTGGALKAGTNTTMTYGNLYITNNWSDYSVQARMQFPVGAFGGGLGGRVNTANGAHYAAWIYPENSAGGSNVLKLVKFQTWTSFSYNSVAGAVMQTTNLASVSTNFHTVKLQFQGNSIKVSWDGNQLLNVADAEAVPYTSGAVSFDLWTDAAGYQATMDDVVVNGLPITVSNDTYTAVSGRLLSVAAPGVLANDSGGNAALNATLLTAPTHGTFALSSNGGFNYTATNNYTGTDTFTYRANDGQSNAGPGTVTITVGANHPPVANNDSYTVVMNTSLSVAAPGVLANDTDADGDVLTAALVSGPTHGVLNLNTNGSLTYTPTANYSGADSFTYRASDGLANSGTATVNISVLSLVPLFSDDFSRGSDPGPLTPWIAQSGNWTVTGGALVGGTNTLTTYGSAYITNTWTNYSVQARLQFPAGAYGGGLSARLNPATGARYVAWVYPESGTANSNVLSLLKFQTWTAFGYNGVSFANMQQVSLASVGTGYHTIKLAFVGNRIAVSWDGVQQMSVTDTEATNYLSGAVGVDFWTDVTGYQMSMDDVLVAALANDDTYSTVQDTPLVVSAPGVLGNDTEVYGSNLTAVVVANPTNGAVTLSSNGGFTYTPNAGFKGTDSFTYRANDGPTNIGTARVALTILAVNHPPILPAQTNRTINELTLLTVTNTATDSDTPAQTLTYQLISPPAGAAIDTNGIITWTPTEAQGPSTNTITTIVTDNGIPPTSATNSFIVTVNEVNTAPVLPGQTNRTILETTLLTVNNTATDTDIPVNTLTYTLLVTNINTGQAVTNAAISSSGVITWTPSEIQGPSTNTFTTQVVDNGVPPLSATNTFTVVVVESNLPPVLPAQVNRTVAPLTALTITNTATDPDIPVNTLAYALQTGPPNASIDANGIITWTPTSAQNNSTNVFTTVVTDFNPWAVNSQHLTATNTFTIVVNTKPVLTLDSTTLALEGCLPTNNAVDPGETVTMLFAIKNSGTGPTTNLVVTLLATNGVAAPNGPQTYGAIPAAGGTISQAFTFTAAGSCGGSITVNLQLQDGASNLGTVTVPIQLGVLTTVFAENFDGVTAPALPVGWTTSSSGFESNWVTRSTIRDTIPNSVFVNDGVNLGLSDLTTPIITLPAGQAQLSFRNNYSFEASTLLPTNGYDGGVLEIKIGTNAFIDITNSPGASWVTNGYIRKIDTQFQNVLSNRWAWSGTNGGFVTTIVNLPTAAQGQPVQLRWRASSDNGNGGAGWYVDTIAITSYACCANTAPTLPNQTDRTINELNTLVVTNTGSDLESPPEVLSYQLLNPPAGAGIDSNGVITWTPTEAQGPSTNLLVTVVSDNANPPLSATNFFTVVVQEVNTAPVLPAQSNRTITGLTTLVVTNTATDSDIPANTLNYQLLANPAGASISLTGVITWTPVPTQVPSTNVFTTVVTDNNPWDPINPNLSATNSFTVVVAAVHNGPALPAQPNRTVNELTALVVTNTAIDSDLPTPNLTYSLLNPPTGAQISNSGVITWTPSEAQGPSTNVLTTVVTDNGSPALSATNSFTVFVQEVNTAPVLPAQADHTIIGTNTLVVTNTATDSDLPVNTLTYQLLSPPPGSGAEISTNGVITWTPTQAQVPSTNVFTTVVTDNNPWAITNQNLSATNSFTVVVSAVHNGPSLPVLTNATVNELTALVVTNKASDSDVPAMSLSYSLLNPPAGAQISTNGVITWTPTEAQGPGTNVITTVVTDSGSPALSATNSFTVFVHEVNSAPVLPLQTNRTIVGTSPLNVTNTATDSDIPVNTLTYQLLNPPAGAGIDTNGIITWTPAPSEVPSTNVFTTVVTDSNPWATANQNLSATNSFTVVVTALHGGPVLPTQPNVTMPGSKTLVVTNTATDNDVPTPTLTYVLTQSPAGAAINSSGIITWTPVASQVPSTNVIETVVSDNGAPALRDTNRFTVVVTIGAHYGPLLPVQADWTTYGTNTIVVANTAVDTDLPTPTITYTLLQGPTNATIDANGVITWTPTSDQIPSTTTFVTAARDDFAVPVSSTNSFHVTVLPAPDASVPIIQSLVVSNEIVTLTWSAISNRVYRVQFIQAFAGGVWTDLAPDVTATNSTASTTNAVSNISQRFYRVLLLP
jgi:VCBS repeat-containing protein